MIYAEMMSQTEADTTHSIPGVHTHMVMEVHIGISRVVYTT